MKCNVFLIAAFMHVTSKLAAHDACKEVHEEDAFNWSKEKTDYAAIRTQVAGPGIIQNFIHVSGKVIINPDHIAHVVSKLQGSVIECKKNVGDVVEKDEVVAIVDSKEIAAAKATYLASLQKWRLQQRILDAENRLRGISAGQDYLKAEWAAEEAQIQLNLSMQNLMALGLRESQIRSIEKEKPESFHRYEIKSPLAGRIVQRDAHIGTWVGESAKIYTIGNFDTVLVEVKVPQDDVHFLKKGLSIEVAAAQGKSATGLIGQFVPIISEETRTATAFAQLDNAQKAWSPGEFVIAQVQTDLSSASVVIPLTALQMIKGEPHVFVEMGETFIPCPVKLGKKDHEQVEIVSGLECGASYAAFNTFCLKAELQKEEAEHSH